MTREEILTKYFIDITLEPEHLDLYYVRRSLLKFIDSNIPQLKGTLLDVGCGIMPYRERILSRNEKITSYIGLDFDNSLDLEYALGKPDLFWTGEIIPMAHNTVDTIIATEFFEHCPEPEKIMREMLRVLRPGGILLFTVPFVWNLHLVPYDEYRYTPFSMERLLANTGFSDIQLTPLGGWDASLAQMIAIWFHNRPLSKRKKFYLAKFILPVIKKLISMDSKYDQSQLFKDGGMITGIGGIAFANR